MIETETHLISKTRVIRAEEDCGPNIAFGLEDRDGEQWFFSMADADAYDFIRRMTSVLFDAEPPKRVAKT